MLMGLGKVKLEALYQATLPPTLLSLVSSSPKLDWENAHSLCHTDASSRVSFFTILVIGTTVCVSVNTTTASWWYMCIHSTLHNGSRKYQAL